LQAGQYWAFSKNPINTTNPSMKHAKSNRKKWFGYTLYAILLGVGLLYYMFPSDAVKEYLEATARKINPNFILTVGKVRPSFWFGLTFEDATLSHKAHPRARLLLADSLLIRPVVWSFLYGKGRYCFAGRAYDGEVRGSLHFEENRMGAPFNTSIELKGISIDDPTPVSALIGRSVRGIIDGTITYSGQQNLFLKGTGEADLRVSDGRVELLNPILTFDSIDFNELLVKMVLRNQKIDITNAELKGREIRGTLSGNVSLNRDLLKSSLNLRGVVEPFAGLLKGDKGTATTVKLLAQQLKGGRASFTIRGTLAEPKIKFI
jgi:type II secretion system protein N